MVNKNIIEIILRARDEASDAAKKAEDALKKAGDTAKKSFQEGEQAGNALEKALNTASNAAHKMSEQFRGISDSIISQLQKAQEKVKNFADEFAKAHPKIKNLAETIKNNISTAMEHVKSKIKSLSNNNTFTSLSNNATKAFNKIKSTANNAINNVKNGLKVLSLIKPSIIFRGNTEPFDNSRMHVYSALQELSRMNINIPIGNIDSAAEHIGRINAAFESVHNAASKVGQTFSSVTSRISNGFSTLKSKIGGFIGSLSGAGAAMRKLAAESSSLGQGFTLLKGALANVVGMIGYDLVNNMVQGVRATINARGNIEAFSQRLGMSGTQVDNFNKQLDQLQKQFKKVDMQTVGATALELANKLGLGADKAGDLARMTAVMSSAFVREGRTSEDAVLAVSDALDGQFNRLKEIGITQDMLKNNGWNGNLEDTASLMDAINKTMDELGITETAQQVTNLDDAWQVLNVSMSHLLTEVIIPFVPIIVGLIEAFADAANTVSEFVKNLPDGAKIGLVAAALAVLAAVIWTQVQPALEALILDLLVGESTLLPIIVPFLELAAVVAAVAIVVYELGKAMGWWTDYGSAMKVVGDALRNVFDKIVACLQTVYNGFMQIVNPVIQQFWKELVEIVQPLQKHFQELWNKLVELGAAFGGASGSGSLFATIGRVIGVIIIGIINNIKMLLAVLIPLIGFIVNVVISIIDFLTQLKAAWDLLMEGDILGFLTLLGQALMDLVLNILASFGTMILEILTNLDTMFGGVLTAIWNWLVQIAMSMYTGGYNAIMGFIAWLSALPGMAWTWLWNTILNFYNWAVQVKDKAVQAGINAVNGFIDWLKTLPGKAWTWLLNTLAKILGFGDDGGQKMQNAGTKMVNGLMNWLKQLPGKVWDELMNIGQQILNGKGPLVDKIVDLGRRMLDGFLNALGIHSPGYMAQNAGSEMGYIVDAMMNNQQSLADAGASVGQSILEGYNTNDFSSMEVMPNVTTPEVSEIKVPDTSVAMSVNPELMASDNQMIIDSTSQMQQQVGLQLTQLGLNITQLGTTSTENMNTILTNNTQLTQSYNILQNNIQQALLNILTNTKLQWNNIKTTTEQNLKSILNSTNNVTQQMIDAWKKMKDSIVEAAGDIRTQASQRFDTLWSNIKTFYHNIQHPGGAGPSQPRGIRHSRGAVNLNAISNMVKPSRSFMTKQQVTKLGLSPADLSYIKTKNNTYNTEDILTGLQRGGAGGWTATVKPNLDFIKDKSSKWKIAGPIILGRYPTQDRFKVGEFENGTPNIDFGTFVGIAEDVFSQIHYDFYMDSSKYGSWQAAARTGYMNCSDGTDFLLAIAEACGFHGTKVHGYWGNIGHFWAEINGKKMDTTGFTKGLGWSPAQSHAGPAPGAMDVNDENVPAIIVILRNILEYLQGKKEDETNNAVVVHDGQVSLNVNCNFEGNVPEGVTAEDVANMLNNMITDRKVLQAITSSADFQELDRRYKNKLTGAMERFRPSI